MGLGVCATTGLYHGSSVIGIEKILEVSSGIILDEGGVRAAVSSPIPTILKIQVFRFNRNDTFAGVS
jgi:hypothetical protein